jgi:hypothetical protein
MQGGGERDRRGAEIVVEMKKDEEKDGDENEREE